jgi:hypothetical protein
MNLKVSPRAWAYAGLGLGGAVSVAANIAHSYASSEPGGPEFGAVAGAAFWPVALFVAIEILARTPWPDARGWLKAKLFVVRYAGLGLVSLVAAVVSYRHLSGLLTHYGEDTLTAQFGPLAVDGLMVMATGALLATTGHKTAHAVPDVMPGTPESVPAAVVPAVPEAHPEHVPDNVLEPVPPLPQRSVPGTRPQLVSVPSRRRPGTRARHTATDAELLKAAAEIAAGLPPGTALGRRNFLTGLKAKQIPCGNTRADQILARYEAEQTNRQEA